MSIQLKTFLARTGLTMVLALLNSTYWVIQYLGGNLRFKEYSAIENVQTVYLAGALLLWAVLTARARDAQVRVFYGAFTLLTLNLLHRELPPRQRFPYWIRLMQEGPVSNTILVILWLVLIVLVVRNFRDQFRRGLDFLNEFSGRIFVLGVCMYLAALPFDKDLTPFKPLQNIFFEELWEINGTLFFFMSPLILLLSRRKKSGQ